MSLGAKSDEESDVENLSDNDYDDNVIVGCC